MPNRDQVILVDQHDNAIGVSGKLAAHAEGLLHRAISVFIFNARGEWLLQRRHASKYHSGGLWSNTCCSHPQPGEATADAARNRLFEEMGIRCPLEPAFQFIYRAEFPNKLLEHELDHVFIGEFEGVVQPDPAEVAEWRWAAPGALREELLRAPERFTYWFHACFDRVRETRRFAA